MVPPDSHQKAEMLSAHLSSWRDACKACQSKSTDQFIPTSLVLSECLLCARFPLRLKTQLDKSQGLPERTSTSKG